MDADLDHAWELVRHANLPGLLWPIYGTLISNLVNVIEIVDDVATSQPVRT